MQETGIVIALDGPHPGCYHHEFDNGDIVAEFPGFIPDKGGKYVKVSEMTLFPEQQGDQVTRSATYRWKPEEG
jgi:hypothetical protein